MAVLGIMSFIPLYATTILGMSTLESGAVLTPRSVGTLAASFVTSIFLPRWGYRWPMLVGTGAAILSVILLGMEPTGLNFFGTHISGTVLLVIILFISGVAMGITAPAANNACIELLPTRVATITGVRGMFRQTGSVISIAITTVVLQNFSSIGRGFMVVFYGLAVVLALSIPFIFAMPASCVVKEQVSGNK
jgi:MFS family permease